MIKNFFRMPGNGNGGNGGNGGNPHAGPPFYGYTVSTDFGGGAPSGPWVIPPDFPGENGNLTIYIPGVAGTDVISGSGSCDLSTGNDDFTLSWTTYKPPGGDTQHVAQVDVSATNLYTAEPANRAALLANFNKFRQQLEGLSAGCLNRVGQDVIMSRIAGAIPLMYDEILAFHYGFNAESRYIDLVPGMRLRVETGSYQYVAPSGFSGGGLNSYSANGTMYIDVCQQSNGQIGFNSYMGAMSAFQVNKQAVPILASNELDIMALGFQRNYARLLYPPTFNNSTKVTQNPEISTNVSLLMADTLNDLELATQSMLTNGTLPTSGTTGDNPPVSAWFSGRTVLVPEHIVVSSNVPLFVPVGTTLWEMVGKFITPGFDVVVNMENFLVNRWGQVAFNLAQGQDRNNLQYLLREFGFDPVTAAVEGTTLTQWDMPLLKGDTLSWS